ncbi:MAG: response regulator [Desulfobacterales bacterium]|nr:MAG: response regulator [Desulfobacterales bacterium]
MKKTKGTNALGHKGTKNMQNSNQKCSRPMQKSSNPRRHAVEEKYQRLLELSKDGVIIVQEGVVKECNGSFSKLCGQPMDAILHASLQDIIHPVDAPAIEFQSGVSLSDKNPAPLQKAIVSGPQGHRRDVEITSGRLTYLGKPAHLLIIRDVSARIQARQEIEKARQLESIAALSGGIAHDYNNLLTAIIGNITLAQSYLAPAAKASGLLSQALEAAMMAKNLTQKLITFSKGGEPDKTIAGVAKLVRSATEFTLSGSNVKCEYALAEDLRPVEIDQTQVGQALHNIVLNAREAMPNGGILRVTAENLNLAQHVLPLERGSYVKISIADQGNGIPATDLSKIFDPYYSTKERGDQKGTGLGLSIGHSIIKKHGGGIAVESQIGVGTTFHIYLPAAEHEVLAMRTADETATNAPVSDGGRILVMDDEKMIRELAGEILSHLGYQVDFARDGQEAVTLYQQALTSENPFDAVILDLTVRGGMGGKEAIRKLIQIDPDVKAIVSSGYSADPGITDFRKYGFRDVAAKPYTVEQLGARLTRVLGA